MIKFRIWDKSLRKMYTNENHFGAGDTEEYYGGEVSICFSVLKNLQSNKQYVFQQWTGLQDKNELDIYEGDVILDVCQWKVWTVVFGKDVPSFLLSDINGAVKFFDRQTAKNDYEVIGTIFGLDKWPCKPDHNGECLLCDCWLSECHLHEHLKLEK